MWQWYFISRAMMDNIKKPINFWNKILISQKRNNWHIEMQ